MPRELMEHDTHIGGWQDRFPSTRRSVIEAARGGDAGDRQAAWETLIAAYWKPAYKYIRVKWQTGSEEAKDLTQGFLAVALEKGLIERYSTQRASFRTYLRMCIDGYVANERKAAGRLKRGGEHRFVALDFEAADRELSGNGLGADPEACFDRECLRSLFEQAILALQSTCETAGKSVHFRLFERYDLTSEVAGQRPSYEQLAAEVGLPVTQVTNYLAWARRTFRRCVMDALRELTASDEEFRAEARRLLGVEA